MNDVELDRKLGRLEDLALAMSGHAICITMDLPREDLKDDTLEMLDCVEEIQAEANRLLWSLKSDVRSMLQDRADKKEALPESVKAVRKALTEALSDIGAISQVEALCIPLYTVMAQFNAFVDSAKEWLEFINNLYPAQKTRNEAFLAKVMKTDWYDERVKSGLIEPPWQWNGTITDLSDNLTMLTDSDIGFMYQKRKKEGGTTDCYHWIRFDQVFSIDGVMITSRQLEQNSR